MRILLGVTGGVAAFKSLEVLRALKKLGHTVEVVATPNALKFVGKASFEALSGTVCHSEMYEDTEKVLHVALAKVDLVIVAPATASFVARYAHGIADDLLLNVLLATTARVVIAPAMHTEMWAHDATQTNIETLIKRGVEIVEPEFGELTSGDVGKGRLAAVERIVELALASRTRPASASKNHAVVTAGGTREAIDDVRFIANSSSGKQGVSLARELNHRGYSVTLIGANLEDPLIPGVEFISVSSHKELAEAMWHQQPNLLLMNAAVSDYSLSKIEGKLRRGGELVLKLEPTTDLVSNFARERPACKVIAFAAEPGDDSAVRAAGLAKLHRKSVAAIVANPTSAIGADKNSGWVLTKTGSIAFSGSKHEAAVQILDALESLDVLA